MKRRMVVAILALWAPLAMAAGQPAPEPPKKVVYHGMGVLNRVEPFMGLVNISHGEVPFAGWSAYTRDLRVKPRELTQGLTPGMTIRFQLTQVDPLTWVITAVEPVKQ